MKGFALLFLVILSISCKNEDIDVPVPVTMTFTFDLNVKGFWVVLSDSTGKVLDWKSLVRNQPSTLSYDCKAGTNSCVLTLVTELNGGGYLMETFTNVTPEDYTFTGREINVPAATGKYQINIEESFGPYYLSTDNFCGIDQSKPGHREIEICGPPNHIFIQTIEYDNKIAPKYLFTTITSPGTLALTSDLLSSLPEMKRMTIDLKQAVTDLGMLVSAELGGQKRIDLYQSFASSSPAKSSLFYPVLTGVDASYFVNLKYSKEANSYFAFQVKGPVADFKFEELNVNLLKRNSNTTEKLSYEFDGETQYGYATLSPNPTVNWSVHFPVKTSVEINLPQFPADFLKEVDFAGLEKNTFSDLILGENAALADYNQYYNSVIRQKLNQNNIRSRGYTFN